MAAAITRVYGRWLSPLSTFHHAIELWSEGDVDRDQAEHQAAALHAAVRAGGDIGRIRPLLDSLAAIDVRVTDLDRGLSAVFDGEARWFDDATLYTAALMAVLLAVIGTVVTLRLLHHERAATEVVHQHAEEFRTLIENAPDIIFRIDRGAQDYVRQSGHRTRGGDQASLAVNRLHTAEACRILPRTARATWRRSCST